MPLEQCIELRERLGPKKALAMALDEKLARKQRAEFAAPGGLLRFVRHFWHVLEPDTEFVEGWALAAMAEHLEATADGRITRLLENVPPGSMKSLLSSVFFPAWLWGAKRRPGTRILCMSYSEDNPQRDNRKTINLINSPEYQRLYGKVFRLTKAGEELLETDKTGYKQAVGIRGSVTGKRAGFLLCDDPNNVVDVESDAIREETNRKFREAVVNRINDMVNSVIIVIQQRSHEDDVSGMILQEGWPYVHLCIPLLFEPDRRCETSIGWRDPREVEGECFWPERFTPEAVQIAMDMGEFAFAGQYQMRPEPRGGGILKREYWQDWNPEPNPRTGKREFPVCDFVVASLDPAFTSKEENDPAGFTIWGAFQTPEGKRGAILLDAFSLKLDICGPDPVQAPGEEYEAFRERTKEQWGLVETVFDRCRKFRADVLLIENKASGLSVIQMMEKLFVRRKFRVEAIDPRRLDKMARAIRVQPEFSGGYVYAPLSKEWAKGVVNECALFPRGRHDDRVDSATQALYWMRTHGFLERSEEQFLSREESARKYKDAPPLYNI